MTLNPRSIKRVSEAHKFFCYEKNHGGRWCPVFYTEDPALRPAYNGKESRPRRSLVAKVPVNMTLTEAMALHPAPVRITFIENK